MQRAQSSSLSIVTICRDVASTIERTCQSIVSQDAWQGEWIVVDGGSTDGTTAILERYRSRMSHYQSGPDGGIYAAMNIGAQHAAGDYLLFLNGGDTLHDAHVAAEFESHAWEAPLVVGNIRICYPSGAVADREESAVTDIRHRLYWRSLPHPASFFRREAFLASGGYDERYRILGDREFYMRVLLRGNWSYAGWPRCVADFYNDGISADPTSRRCRGRELGRIRKAYYGWPYRVRWHANREWGRFCQQVRLARRICRANGGDAGGAR